jgi:hypothetical protein
MIIVLTAKEEEMNAILSTRPSGSTVRGWTYTCVIVVALQIATTSPTWAG